MVAIAASSINLHKLISLWDLQLVEDEEFFPEWVDYLPEINDFEKHVLDLAKSGYLNLINYRPLPESTVKMVILAPLLQLAGFYESPFRIETKPDLEINLEDEEETVIRGRMDVLVLNQELWVMAIESKGSQIAIETGLAQILTYMLAAPHKHRSSYGMITNGREFQFVKMIYEPVPRYGLSDSFDLRNRGNEIYTVLKIMKRLAQILVRT